MLTLFTISYNNNMIGLCDLKLLSACSHHTDTALTLLVLFLSHINEYACLQVRTTDMGGYATRSDFTEAVIRNLAI